MTHRDVSLGKSFLRIIGFFALPYDVFISAILLVTAEVLGIIEELV